MYVNLMSLLRFAHLHKCMINFFTVVGFLNDLWKFDGTNWTWISGSKVINQPGIYGEKRVADPNNIIGSRHRAVSWIDSKKNLYLFGGIDIFASGNYITCY